MSGTFLFHHARADKSATTTIIIAITATQK